MSRACVTSRPFLIIFHREAPTSKQGSRRGKNWKIQLILEVFKIFFRLYFDMGTSAPNDISNLFLCQIQMSPFIITLNDIWPVANEKFVGRLRGTSQTRFSLNVNVNEPELQGMTRGALEHFENKKKPLKLMFR